MENNHRLQANDANGDLSKPWYISFYYPDPQTGKLKRFRETADINRISTVKQRREALYDLKSAKLALLNNGWSPFQQYDPQRFLEDAGIMFTNISEAIDKVLEHKKLLIKPTSYANFANRAETFRTFLEKKNMNQANVKDITKKYILEFLDKQTREKKLSSRTRDNYRIDLRSLFSTMLDMEFIEVNPVAGVKRVASESERNVLYTQEELTKVFNWLDENKPQLWGVTDIISLKKRIATTDSLFLLKNLSQNVCDSLFAN